MRYNPRAPYIIGEEWVPIRQSSYLPSQEEERGYTFTIDAAATIVSGAFYVQDRPTTTVTNQVEMIALYPGDTEDLTGPMMQVIIPVSSISTTGGVVGAVTDLDNPSDSAFVIMNADDVTPTSGMTIQFDVSAYQNALQGKRIVDVSLLYTVASFNVHDSSLTSISICRTLNVTNFVNYDTIGQYSPSLLAADFDSVNVFWHAAAVGSQEIHAYPWRWEELVLFDETAAAATKLSVLMTIDSNPANPNASTNRVDIGYAALQVTFCEERRVLYGGKRILAALPRTSEYLVGGNFVQLRTTALAIPSTVTAAGGYFVSHSHRQLAESRFNQNRQPPTLYALRQLYEIPTMQSKIVELTETLGNEFVSAPSDVVPYLTLHTASAIVTGVHAYGQQVAAPVYGSITAVQSVNGLLGDGAANGPFTQVRFYARRYGRNSGTLVLRQGTTVQASITEADFDTLPEIIDGWREVTLDLDADITFTSTDVAYTWEALGVAAGSRWEVLGGDGPTFTGAHSNTFASYDPPAQGDVLELSWKNINQLVTTEDDQSDAVLIFSQDPPTVTGFTVVGAGCSVPVTGVGAECDLPSVCLPTAIYGNQLSWTGFGQCDTFDRDPVVDGFGVSTSGHPWTESGGAVGDYATDGEQGIITIPTGDTTIHTAMLPQVLADFEQWVTVGVDKIAVGQTSVIDVMLRAQDPLNNLYRISIGFTAGGNIDASLVRVIGGAGTTLASATSIFPYVPGQEFNVYARGIGSTLEVKIWPGDPEDISIARTLGPITDATYASGQFGVRARLVAGSTTINPAFMFDDFETMLPHISTIEIERRDALTDWQTIATVSPCVTGMCDLEARVGMESEYRIRTCNVLDFCGPWVTGAGTLAVPGVDGVGVDGNGVLIFTSNRAPGSSLAYVMAFERDTTEDFTFPEASFTRLDAQFGRDFFVAFRPLERGGDEFSRPMLINAMAIPVESLPNINDLRDLAWDDLPYVCVRDELGNRWFANVRVPAGRIRRNRTLYYAQIDVTRVTETAAPVEDGGVG